MFQVMVQGSSREAIIANAMALVDMLGGNAGPVELEGPQETAKGAKKGPGRPPKAAEEKVAETAPPTPPAGKPKAFNPFEDEAPAKKVYTFDQVKAALMEVAKPRTGDADESVGYGRVAAILNELGCKSVKELKEEQYAAVMAKTGLA